MTPQAIRDELLRIFSELSVVGAFIDPNLMPNTDDQLQQVLDDYAVLIDHVTEEML